MGGRSVYVVFIVWIISRQDIDLWILQWDFNFMATICFSGSVSPKQKNRHIGRLLKLTGAGDGTRTRDTLLGRSIYGLAPFSSPFEPEKQEKTASFRY